MVSIDYFENKKGRTHLFILWENKLLQLETKGFEATERVVAFPRGRCG